MALAGTSDHSEQYTAILYSVGLHSVGRPDPNRRPTCSGPDPTTLRTHSQTYA
jgi:hypothetical protein